MAFAPSRRSVGGSKSSHSASWNASGVFSRCGQSMESSLDPEQEKGLQLLREQITLSRIAWNKKRCLAKTVEELTRDVEAIKRADQETRRLQHIEQMRHHKRDEAHYFRLSNNDATVKAKHALAEESAWRGQRVMQCRKDRERMLHQAKENQALQTKRRTETVKTELLTNDLEIERSRVAATASKAANAQELRDARERTRDQRQKTNFMKWTNQRWKYECDRQDQFAKSIEETMEVIKHIHLEKTRLSDSFATARSSMTRETTTRETTTRETTALHSQPAAKREAERPSARSTPMPGSTSLPVATARSTSSTCSSSRQRSFSADQLRQGSTLFDNTQSSSAKRTPRCDSAKRFRNRYGNWEKSLDPIPAEKSQDTDLSAICSPRETIIFSPRTPCSTRVPCSTPRTPCSAQERPNTPPESPPRVQVQCQAGMLRADDTGFARSFPLKAYQVDTGASPQTDIHTVECHTDEFLPGEVIFMPSQMKKITPQCFVANDTTECLYYETPSLQADAAGQIRQVPLTPVFE